MSQLANKFVRDPRALAKAGAIVKVPVVEVDLARQRIALTMTLDAPSRHLGERDGDEAFSTSSARR